MSLAENLVGGNATLSGGVKPVLQSASGVKLGDSLGSGNANLVPCVTNANVSLSAAPTSAGTSGSIPSNLVVSSLTVQGGKISYDPVATVMTFTPASISSIYVSSVNGQPVGGGGSSDPNPNFSTITAVGMKATSSITVPYIAGGGTLDLVGTGSGATTLAGQGGTAIKQTAQKVIELSCGGGVAPGHVLIDNCAYVDMTTTALNVSSISVSTINGAPYAPTSIPADLSISSITFGNNGFINNVSSINNIAYPPPQPPLTSINVSTAQISSLNGGVPAVFQFQPFTSYTQGGNSCSLVNSYYSLVNGVGQLVMTFPETPGASWSGGGKYIVFGTAFNSGGMPSQWHLDNVSITCPDGTGAYNLNSWQSQVSGNQLTFNVSIGGSPSTFAITANVRTV